MNRRFCCCVLRVCLWLQVAWLRFVGIQFRGCFSPAAQTTPSLCGTSGAAKEPQLNCRDTSRTKEIPVECSNLFHLLHVSVIWLLLLYCVVSTAIKFRVCATPHTPASSSPAAVTAASSYGTWTLRDKRWDERACNLRGYHCARFCVHNMLVFGYFYFYSVDMYEIVAWKTQDDRIMLPNCKDLCFKTFDIF